MKNSSHCVPMTEETKLQQFLRTGDNLAIGFLIILVEEFLSRGFFLDRLGFGVLVLPLFLGFACQKSERVFNWCVWLLICLLGGPITISLLVSFWNFLKALF